MTEIDLVDWTIQEAQQLKSERCQPSDLDGGPSLDRLLAVLEPDPVGATNSEEPVVRIASAPSMQMAVEEPTSTSVKPLPCPSRTPHPICQPSPRPHRGPLQRHEPKSPNRPS